MCNKKIIVAEGYFDILNVVETANAEGYDIVCTWHAEVTSHQKEKLLSFDKPLVFGYDNDPAGDIGWKNAKRDLSDLCIGTVSRLKLTGDEDLGDLTSEQFKTLLPKRK